MSKLFSPLALRDVTARNRIWVSPMCMYGCDAGDGRVTDWHITHYGQFALGGAGLITTEATAVSPRGRVTPQDAGLWDDSQIGPWRRVTDVAHSSGALMAVQLAHAGRKGGKYRGLPGDEHADCSVRAEDGGWQTQGATGEPFGPYAAPERMTEEDILHTIAAFAAAAVRADAAGFDAVELHAAHGYILHEFLSPLTNSRNDKWGGSPENRERMLLDTVKAVRATMPAGKPLLVRLSTSDAVPGGATWEESAGLAARLGTLGVDLIDCSSGGLLSGVDYRPGPGYQLPGSIAIKQQNPELMTAAVGCIDTPEQAATIVDNGLADAVMIGRAHLRNPHWASHASLALSRGKSMPSNPRYARAYPRV